jgi:hypothetical protein
MMILSLNKRLRGNSKRIIEVAPKVAPRNLKTTICRSMVNRCYGMKLLWLFNDQKDMEKG